RGRRPARGRSGARSARHGHAGPPASRLGTRFEGVMLLFAGAAVVLLSVLGGYMWEEGKLLALNQPAEFLIIGGAAAGTMLVSTPVGVIKDIVAQLKRLLSPAPTKDDYGKLLAMLYELFRLVQQTGVMALETHVETPAESPILSKYPAFLRRHHAVHF